MGVKQSLGRLTSVKLRDCWEREDTDFTPWLASEANIVLLGETIGMELEVEQEEASVGEFRADILCRDTASDALVIVENQLERTDHTHLGQTLTYAAGLKAQTIVWIAASFREEHRSALDWLNEMSAQDINFFGIEIELWQIGDSEPAPKFNVVAKPNNWSRSAKVVAERRGSMTPGQTAQFEYWTAFAEYLQAKPIGIRPPKPYPVNWMSWGLGRSGGKMMAIANAKEIMVGVDLDSRAHPTWFEKLHEDRGSIEEELGFALEWQQKPGNKFSILRIRTSMDTRAKSKRPAAFAWMIKHMQAIETVFRPRFRDLDDTPLVHPSDAA